MPRKKKEVNVDNMNMDELNKLSDEISEYFQSLSQTALEKGRKFLDKKGLK